MKQFVIVSIFDDKKINKYHEDNMWKKSDLIPFFDSEICFSRNKEFAFEDLIELFLHGDEDEQIGALSIIAENFSAELLEYLNLKEDTIPVERVKYLMNYVLPDYLPLYLSKEKLITYEFSENYKDDVWVKILYWLRKRLQEVKRPWLHKFKR